MLTLHSVNELHPIHYHQHVTSPLQSQSQCQSYSSDADSHAHSHPTIYELSQQAIPTLQPTVTRHHAIKHHTSQQHHKKKKHRWKIKTQPTSNGNHGYLRVMMVSSSPSPSSSSTSTSTSSLSSPPPLALIPTHQPSSPKHIHDDMDDLISLMSSRFNIHQQEREEIDTYISHTTSIAKPLEDVTASIGLASEEHMIADLEDRLLMIQLESGPEGELYQDLLHDTCHLLIHAALKTLELTQIEAAESKKLLYGTPPGTKIADNGDIIITGKEMACLRSGTWLLDEVINFYLHLLNERCKKHVKQPVSDGMKPLKCHFFTTYFYTALYKMNQYTYKNVQRWSKRANVDIFSLDLVLIPIHVGQNHWCLAVIDFTTHTFCYYDSLGGDNPTCLINLRRYIQDEHQFYHKKPYDLNDWKDLNPKRIPRQENGCDCGVFTLKFADYISHGVPLIFKQKHMPMFRQRIALEIASQRLLW